VNVKPKRKVLRQQRKREQTPVPSVLKRLGCHSVVYDFEIPMDSFKATAFSRTTGLEQGDNWSTVLPSDSRLSGYHVHFKGTIESKRVRMTIEYWDNPVGRTKDHPEPSAEGIMQWIGGFVRDPSSRAIVMARFQKPSDTWKSRFNLPFKVTMGEAEVVIDGVSLLLPRNQFRAVNGWLTKAAQALFITVDFVRPIEFSQFNLAKDVASFNEAIKIFAEPLV
jgi:hypothetical protein